MSVFELLCLYRQPFALLIECARNLIGVSIGAFWRVFALHEIVKEQARR